MESATSLTNQKSPSETESFRYLQQRMERGVLVLTVTLPELNGEERTMALTQELIGATKSSGASKVVLDLSHVTYLASLGISALLKFRRELRERGGQMLLCQVAPLVADVLMVCQLASTNSSMKIPFGLAPDVATAVTALAGTAQAL